MKPGNFFLILLIAFSLLSCEEKTFNELDGEGTLLKEIVSDGEVIYKYTYNDADLVEEEKSKYHYTKHIYNSKKQLTQSDHYWDESIMSSSSDVLQKALNRTDWVSPENTARDSYITFEYHSSGQLKNSTVHTNNGTNYTEYLYNADRIEKKTTYTNNMPSSYETYNYDQNDNLIKAEKYLYFSELQPKLSSSTEYFHDNKNNPYLTFHALLLPGEHTNKNNINKEVNTIFSLTNGTADDVQTTEFTYSYNSKDFPETRSDGIEYTYY